MTSPLIINNWQTGIADSEHLGFGLMKNVNIEEFPGGLKVSKQPTSLFQTALSATFTAATSDICTKTSSGTLPITGTAVVLSTTTTLPAPLVVGTIYFIINLGDGTTFKLATTIALANAGTAINITDTGTGTHTIATVNPGTINHIVKDYRLGVYYLHDSNARVWYTDGSNAIYLLNGNTLTNGSGKGLAIFRTSDGTATYLFVFRNATIDVINVYGTADVETPVWTTAWQSLNTGAGTSNSHYAMTGQDNIIYFCDDRYVGSIRETLGDVFDPADAASYTFNNQALDMPQGEIINWLEELGTNLMAAGNSYDKIYPWDRISDTFNLPITVPEMSIYRMKNIGSILYILAGRMGNVYATNGTYVTLLKKLPYYVTNNAASLTGSPITWGGIGIRNGALLFGVAATTSANSGAYLLYPDGTLVIDNQPTTVGNPIAIFSENDFYFMGFASGFNYSSSSRRSAYDGIVQTQLYRVGLKDTPVTYSNIEVQIANPVATGHIRIKHRTNTTGSFGDALITCTADSTNTSFSEDCGGSLNNIENIQFQIEMDGLMELMEVRLIP